MLCDKKERVYFVPSQMIQAQKETEERLKIEEKSRENLPNLFIDI